MYLTYTSRMMESRRDGLEEGISIGLERGREEGAYEKALETARNFLSMGLSLEQVVQGTNLPIGKVRELAGKM